MSKKESSAEESQPSDLPEQIKPEAEKIVVKKNDGKLKCTEWARQDPEKPDSQLFAWWDDNKGSVSKDYYEEVKSQVFRKRGVN